MWLHQVRALRPRFQVIAPDFPAHGASAGPDDPAAYSEAAFARHALALLDSLNIEREHPERVRGLLITNTGGGSDDPCAARANALTTAHGLLQEGFEPFVQSMLGGSLFHPYASRNARTGRHMALLLRQHPARGLALVQRGIHAMRPPMQERDLEAIRLPTTIVVGSLDTGCLAASRRAAERIRGARYFEVPGAGHMTPLEAPAQFNAILEKALS